MMFDEVFTKRNMMYMPSGNNIDSKDGKPSFKIHTDGERKTSGEMDNGARLWNLDKEKSASSFRPHTERVIDIAHHPTSSFWNHVRYGS